MKKKLKLAFMVNESARKITYNKRKKSLNKSMAEITTLCGIDACGIIYSEFHSEPEVWPSPSEVQRIINKFKNHFEFEQGNKKKLSHETYLTQRVTKSKVQLVKLEKNNLEMQKSLTLYQCLLQESFIKTLNSDVLNVIACEINGKLEEIASKANELDTNATR
ncbi:agamous-like MADS-box protein AGL80 [Trifolium pratense]|nr:agamous-like MADS-box protein AGL80 [Trifolium pratense]XP_045822301.1 agamous-like MADS-box protein AGL80 [Trifolium pratense]